jgi:subtilisin family serine protease
MPLSSAWRVTAPDGLSDGFTLAQAIVTAVDNGARIVNISLGSPSSAEILMQAIDYATSLGAVLVASAGNDQARAAHPIRAADRRVISVGAVDALGQQVIFSNSGDQLQIAAPGLWLADCMAQWSARIDRRHLRQRADCLGCNRRSHVSVPPVSPLPRRGRSSTIE